MDFYDKEAGIELVVSKAVFEKVLNGAKKGSSPSHTGLT